MPINRAPFNALVDDNGTGLTGSIWNKTAIQNVLLDPIDANPAWVNVPFSAANFAGSGPMTWTVNATAVARNRYAVIGKLFFWSFYISWYSGVNVLGGSPSAALTMFLPAGFAAAASQLIVIDYCAGIAGTPNGAGVYASPSGTGLLLSKMSGANFALSDVPGLAGTLAFEIN